MLKIKHFPYYIQLMRLDKPIGTLLLLWPTLWALWITAEGFPDVTILLIFVLGVFVMRSAGCVINDYADRHIDKHIERTKNRPLTSGFISEVEAITLFIVLCLIAFILVLFLNTYCQLLSIGGLLLATIYPFMKRFTHYPQVVLGMAFSWSIPMAFAAQSNQVNALTWVLYFLTLLWIVAYDTMYAMTDREDDLKVGVKSTAIIFAKADKVIILLLQSASLAGLSLVGWLLSLNVYYFCGLVAASGFMLYQQWLIRERKRQECFKAFLNNNWFGFSVFIGIFFAYI